MAKKPDFQAIYDSAVQAARKAVSECVPTPMIVGEAAGPFSNEFKPGAQLHYVPDGVCGFAWVTIPGNTSFGRWAKQAGVARPGYPSGLQISAFKMVPQINQSLTKGEAAAHAAAKVLREAGVDACAGSRID